MSERMKTVMTGVTLPVLTCANVSPPVVLQYDPDARRIVVDVKKPIGERKTDLTHMAYYMEKDVSQSHLSASFQLDGPKSIPSDPLGHFPPAGEDPAAVQGPAEV